MMHARIPSIFATLALLLAGTAYAADEAPAPGKLGPKTEEFRRVQKELNTVLGQLAGLQLKYRTADEEKRSDILQQSRDLIAKGEKIEPRLIKAAEEAYAEAPNTDPGIAEFLARLLLQKLQEDDYEPAARIGKLLVENRCPMKELFCWAGVAAFSVSDFDSAERYLGDAEKEGYFKAPTKDDKLAPVGEVQLHLLPYYKKAWEVEKGIRDAEAKADDLPRVLLKTSKGDIELELFENEAPNTVANFISLVEKKFYDGLTFHRVLGGLHGPGRRSQWNRQGRAGLPHRLRMLPAQSPPPLPRRLEHGPRRP